MVTTDEADFAERSVSCASRHHARCVEAIRQHGNPDYEIVTLGYNTT
jgi:hypothetical protein